MIHFTTRTNPSFHVYEKLVLTSFWRRCRGLAISPLVIVLLICLYYIYIYIYIYIYSLNKFLALLPGTEKFLGGSTRSLAYTDHIIQFGLNEFLALLAEESN